MNIVPPIGPKDAKIVIVGEAPGRTEVQTGRPFSGQAGQLLNKMLAQVGINRDDCYLTNVIKERPPNNNIKHFIDLSRKEPQFNNNAQAKLTDFYHELEALNPNIIIALGNTGMWALTDKKGVTKWRGSILETTYCPKVLVTNHPASCLYGDTREGTNFKNKHYIIHDLTRAAKHSTYRGSLDLSEYDYILEPDFDFCVDYLNRSRFERRVAFDIEVAGTEVSCISFAFTKYRAISIPFIKEGREYFTPNEETHIWKLIASVLEDPGIEKLTQNGTFDATFLYNKYGIRTTNIHDTMIAHSILFPDFPKNLGFQTTWYTEIPYYKDEGKEKFKAQDNKQFWLYNAKDSIVLQEIHEQQMDFLKKTNNLQTYNEQRALIEPLIFMSSRGMRMNVEDKARLLEETEKKEQKLIKQLQEQVGYEINPNASGQVMEYFYDIKGVKEYKNKKTGNRTEDEKALKRIARQGHPEASTILEIRGLDKLRGTYYDMDLDEDNRLRSSMMPITSTLRLSSSQTIFGKGGNVQNLPKPMKRLILPDPGYVMFSMDLSQAENRIVANIAPDTLMIEAFESGTDIHSLTATYVARAFGHTFSIAEIKEQKRLYEETLNKKYLAPIGQGNRLWRYWGKEANHAFNYGLSYKAAALRWEIREKEARVIYNTYHQLYPGVKEYHRWVQHELSVNNRRVRNLFTYNKQFLAEWKDACKQAYAFIPQSTVACVINRGLRFIYQAQSIFQEVELLNQIHDEILFQVPIEIGWDIIAGQLRTIRENLQQPLTHRGRSFILPTETTMHVHNAGTGVELERLDAGYLQDIYERQTLVKENV